MIKNIFLGTFLLGSVASNVLAEPSVPERFALKTPRASQSILMGIYQNEQSQFSVGEHGIILDRQGNGVWTQHDVPVNITLTAISQSPTGDMFAVGHQGVILKKAASGQWQKVFDGYELITKKQANLKQQILEFKEQMALVTDEDELDELTMQLEDMEFAQEDLEGEIESGPTSPLLDVLALDGNRIYALGAYNTLLLSEDGGNEWRLVSHRLENPNNFHLNNMVKSGNTLFIFGEAGIGYRSLDNGQTFETLYMPYEGTFFGGEVYGDFVVAYGLKGNVVFSSNGGDSWQHEQINAKTTLLGSTLDSQGNAWLVGHAGSIVKLSVSDFSFTDFKHPSGDIFTDAVFQGKALTLVGQNGAIQWQANQ